MAISSNWPQSSFTENVSVNSLYELREVLSRIEAAVELGGVAPESIDSVEANGTIRLFASNSPDQYTGTTYPDQLINLNSWFPLPGSPQQEWDNSEPIAPNSDQFGNLYQSLLAQAPDESKFYSLGIDLERVNVQENNSNPTTFNNEWWSEIAGTGQPLIDGETAASSLTRFEESDVVIRLTDNFWDNVQEINDGTAEGFSVNPAIELEDTAFLDGTKVIYLDDYDSSNYKEFVSELTEDLNLSFISDSPLYRAEFNGHIHGNAIFKSASGTELKFNLTDNDEPWGNVSGLGAIDIEIDEDGNHVTTELQFGLHSYQARDFVETIYQNQWSSTSGSGSFDAVSSIGSEGTDSNSLNSENRWELDRIEIWDSTIAPLTNAPNIQELLNDSISNQSSSISFTIKGDISEPSYEDSSLKFEIDNFESSTLNFEDSDLGFDLQLNGPVSNNALNLPLYNNYGGSLHYSAVSSNNSDLNHAPLGNLDININEQYDGLGENNFTITSPSLRNLKDQYPDLSDDTTIDYRLERIQLNSSTNGYGTIPSGGGNISFQRESDENGGNFYVTGAPTGNFAGASLDELFPNWSQIDLLKVSNLIGDDPQLLAARFDLDSDQGLKLIDTDISFDQRITDTSGGDFLQLGYALKGSDQTGNPGGEADTLGVDSDGLTNVAVLGPNTTSSNSYTLEISAESLQEGWNLESADIVLRYNSEIFKEISKEDIQIASELPIKNAIAIDDENGLIRFAAASLGDLDDQGTALFDENIFASIKLDFDEAYFNDNARNPDANGKFTFEGNPLGFELSANRDETVFSRTFDSDEDGNEIAGGAFKNREIKSLGDLKGGTTIDDEDVNLYQAEIKFEEKEGGLTFGTNRVIGASQDFTNLIRKGDTVKAQTTIENIGNSLAKNVTISDAGNLVNARFETSRFIDSDGNEILIDAENPVDLSGGVFNDDFSYDDTKQESVDIEVDMKVTGEAGSVIDTTKGLFEVSADGMGQNPESTDKIFTSNSGSKNLITYQGDLNYDGRVSMKDLAFLNAGAARQTSLDDGSGSVDPNSVARDVDADFSGKIDINDLSVLDQDWGKSLHTGTSEDFTGSSDALNWESLDSQGGATWENTSFKAQNAIEAEESYVSSLETPTDTGSIGANTDSSIQDDAANTGMPTQDPLP